MTYQVSRNGQMYGPYTLEDLRRYIASGNILLTDMAKSEEMPDWVSVAQILGTPAGTAGAAAGVPGVPPPTYATPSAYPQPAGIDYPDPPNMNWGLELLLGFLTCRLFVFVWNLVIASWANRVQPASKALIWYIAATVLFVLELGSSWSIVISLSHHVHPHHSALGNIVGIVAWVVRLIARFTLRDTLEQHFNGPEPLGLRLSAVMTFFFGGIYFQYKFNEINDMKQALRYRNAAR
jgi:GYF domain 2